ncbi:hypothetical protein F4804DRAFT_36168 [Jackrogersella minutella]|nr:hypothetical protein F4804DRAFT_36168 [Jackrogersella minutella]
MATRFNYKNQDAYKEYVSYETRPEGLPGYSMDEDGIPEVAPGELFCRARLSTGEMCANTTKQYQPGNLRNHLKTTHGYAMKNLPAGVMKMVQQQITAKFYVDLMKRVKDNERKDADVLIN